MLAYSWTDFVDSFGNDGAWMMILCGAIFLVYFFFEGIRREGFIRGKKESWQMDTVSGFLRALIFVGIGIGIFVIAVSVASILSDIPPSFKYRDNIGDHYDKLTVVSLIVLGFAMFLKPLMDVPWATFIGLLAGAAVAVAISMIIPDDMVEIGGYQTKYIIAGVFILVSTLVGVIVKFWINGAEFIAKVLSWPPMALIVAIYCFVQGFGLLIWGFTIYQF